MSEPREPTSYYEIALTNAQVLVAFGLLLVCVSGAFVAGMWVARESLSDRLAAAQVAEAAPPQAAREPEQETFEFFGEESAPGGANREANSEAAPPVLPRLPPPEADEPSTTADAAGSSPAAEPLSASTEPAPSEQVEERDAPVEIADAADSERTSPAPPSPPTAERNEAAQAPSRERESSARDASASEPAPAPAVAARDAPAASGSEPRPGPGVVLIQVFSSSEETQANGLIARLRADGYRAFLSPVDVDGRTMYRVRVGPYASRDDAEVDAGKLKRQHRLDTWFPRS